MQANRADIRLQAFGRSCHIVVVGSDEMGPDEATSAAAEEFSRLEDKFNPSIPGSILYLINQRAGSGAFTALDEESASLFRFCNALWKESNHLFDPTISAIEASFTSTDPGVLRQMSGLLPLVDWRKLEVSEEGARLNTRGMRLDMNQVVRPYAVGKVLRLLRKRSVTSALVDFGQDAGTIGKQKDGSNWLVGVKYPAAGRKAISRLKLNEKAFSVRGDFESARTSEGELFSQALSPVDGKPVPGLLSVGVAADTPLEACSAATIARFKTEQAGIKWLESTGLPWLAVDRQLRYLGPLTG